MNPFELSDYVILYYMETCTEWRRALNVGRRQTNTPLLANVLVYIIPGAGFRATIWETDRSVVVPDFRIADNAIL
jgi:hypothetical protein